MHKVIGIYLAPPPGQSMTNQGIGRVLAHLIKGVLQRPMHRVVVAIPSWAVTDFTELLEDHHIEKDGVEFLSVSGMPIWLRIKMVAERWSRRQPQNRLKKVLRQTFETSVKVVMQTLTRRSVLGAVVMWLGLLLLALPVGLLLAMVMIPLAVLLGFLLFLTKWGLHLARMAVGKLLGPQMASLLTTVVLRSPASLFRRVSAAHKVYAFLRRHEVEKLVEKLNSRTEISVWFVPALFWPEIAGIKSRKVVAAPDFVTVDFPTSFREPIVRQLFENCAVSARAADALVCYSEHVRDRHLVSRLGIPKERISVIYNGVADLSSYLCCEEGGGASSETRRQRAREVLADYQRDALQDDPYLCDFDFSSARFIFYSSQVRPHKNFRNLIDAYERLLRREFVNVKLFLTARLDYAPEILRMVQVRRLHRDVVSLFDVPSEVLAALNCLAECAVVPTLFEGGFPSFSFSEAYSVGTPCLMSAIPVTLERPIDPAISERMLFDPLNVTDMVEKFRYGIESRNELYELQRPVWDMLSKRSWDDIAGEYIGVIERCAVQ